MQPLARIALLENTKTAPAGHFVSCVHRGHFQLKDRRLASFARRAPLVIREPQCAQIAQQATSLKTVACHFAPAAPQGRTRNLQRQLAQTVLPGPGLMVRLLDMPPHHANYVLQGRSRIRMQLQIVVSALLAHLAIALA